MNLLQEYTNYIDEFKKHSFKIRSISIDSKRFEVLYFSSEVMLKYKGRDYLTPGQVWFIAGFPWEVKHCSKKQSGFLNFILGNSWEPTYESYFEPIDKNLETNKLFLKLILNVIITETV